jgi:hypothetical protein
MVERLPSKHEALSSNPISPTHTHKKSAQKNLKHVARVKINSFAIGTPGFITLQLFDFGKLLHFSDSGSTLVN